MAATYQFNCCGNSSLVILNRIWFKFHIWIAFITVWFKSEHGFYPTNDDQDGRQNGRHLSVYTCGRSTLDIYFLISSKFHLLLASIKLWFKFEYGFCPTNNNQDGQQNGHHLSVGFCRHSTLVIYYWIAPKFLIWINSIKLWFKLEYHRGFFSDKNYTRWSTTLAIAYQFAFVDTLP